MTDTGLAAGLPLSSVGRRLGAYLLEIVLIIVTLYIGWLVWSLVVWKNGVTPAKQLLGMRVVKLGSNQTATWGTMFMREIVGKFLGGIAVTLTLGVLLFMLVWDKQRQELWDKIAGTVVVDG